MKSIGESRVRTEFNPSKDDVVDQLKQKLAEIINLVDNLKEYKTTEKSPALEVPTADPKKMRLIALAQTSFEEGAMWAVKAATF